MPKKPLKERRVVKPPGMTRAQFDKIMSKPTKELTGEEWKVRYPRSQGVPATKRIPAAKRQTIDSDPPRCEFCADLIPKPRRYMSNVRYCKPYCAKAAEKERRRQRDTEALVEAALTEAPASEPTIGDPDETLTPKGLFRANQVTTGPLYDRAKEILSVKTIDLWVDRHHSDAEMAELLRSTPQAAGKVRRQLWNDRMLGKIAGAWTPRPEHAALLGPSDQVMAALAETDPDAFEAKLSEMVDAFTRWRTEFFSAGFDRAYITKPFHQRWIEGVLRAIYRGGRLMVLSPPRHGKTDLLIHFCVWVICRNPDIRILWVGPNDEIAKNCLGMTRELLENHEALASAYLAPGQSWAPQRRGGGLWAADKFTVATRRVPMKQPTMWSAGVGGRILSLDADFIVVDDPADPDASFTQGGRDKIDNWFKVKLASRKMDHTALCMISSRVHVDDLYAQYVDHSQWEVIVDAAHQRDVCGLALHDAHDPGLARRCVLFAELNPLTYLREQADVVGMPLFEMMYLNQPRPDGALTFDPDKIRLYCLDRSRDLGISGLVGGYRLIAGLDPAAQGTQAAFCWAVQTLRHPDNPARALHLYHMVDSETQKAGGIEGAMDVIVRWYDEYDLRMWVIEDNAYQSVFFRDPRVKQLAASRGIELKPTTTGPNKHDPRFGVAAMAPLFHEGRVTLPYATLEARRKVDAYIMSLLRFDGEAKRAKKGSDLLMASWFPHADVIRRWTREDGARVVVSVDPNMSFPGYHRVSYDSLPWGDTPYPYRG